MTQAQTVKPSLQPRHMMAAHLNAQPTIAWQMLLTPTISMFIKVCRGPRTHRRLRIRRKPSPPYLTLSGPGRLTGFLIYPFFLINQYHSQHITGSFVDEIENIKDLYLNAGLRDCSGHFIWLITFDVCWAKWIWISIWIVTKLMYNDLLLVYRAKAASRHRLLAFINVNILFSLNIWNDVFTYIYCFFLF